ncbi:MAG: DNA polymerase I [Desulfobacterales bacterium]
MDKTLYLIDGNAYIHRAFHAIRGLSNSEGLPTNAVFGFTRMLIKLMEDRSPAYMAMIFDAKGPTFRHDIYSGYKANRSPMPEELSVQIPHIRAVTAAYNIPAFEMSGFEADDLIGTLARKGEQAGFFVVIVSGDKDFMQLVTEKTVIWDPMKDRTIDVAAIRDKFGLEPHQMIEVMGLSGDTADSIPGVPGIGEKTAVSLIKTFDSMDRLYEQLDRITKKKQKENLIQFKDQAMISRKLVIIDTDVALPFDPEALACKEPDIATLADLFKMLEFRQLQQALPQQSDLSEKTYHSILDEEQLDALVDRLRSSTWFALDTETTAKRPMAAELVGLSFSVKPDEAFYIPCAHDYPGAPQQLDRDHVLNRLKPILEDPNIGKIGQNIKYDMIVLHHHGIHLAGIIFDTMIASYLINPSVNAHSLDQIALDRLGHKMITYQEVTADLEKTAGFSSVPLKKATPYACEDADITLMAYTQLGPMLEASDLTALFEDVEMPLVPVLARMERTGVRVDKAILRELSTSFEYQLGQIEENIYAQAGETFNIKSSQQLGRILFEKLDLPVQKKTKKKTGYSTDVDVLTILAAHHELPALILRHRTLAKLKSTYTDALIDLVHDHTGRLHTSFNQTITATGRLSSSHPNLQNIPIRTDEGRDIRRAFIPAGDWYLVSADYSQIELRILAHCSEDRILIDAFKNDEDIHTRTAAEVFQIDPQHISAELRRQAKAINFGIVYGMSPFGLSKQLGISLKMAKTIIDNYFDRYQGVKQFMTRAIQDARETGRTSTLLGRIRRLPDIQATNRNTRQFAERTAINTPIQGTAADLIKLSMIRVDDELRKHGFQTEMLLSVHDELVFEVPPDELERAIVLIRDIMEGVWHLSVPLKVNVVSGRHWAEAH